MGFIEKLRRERAVQEAKDAEVSVQAAIAAKKAHERKQVAYNAQAFREEKSREYYEESGCRNLLR